MPIVLLWSIATLSAQVNSPSSAKSDWNVRDQIPVEKFIIQSHRGAGELAPENTLEAFQLGWKLGTIPECDVRTTSDGVIVTFHDDNFKRVVKNVSPELQDKGVKDITFKELSSLDVGSWKGDNFEGRRVSRLSDVFEQMHGHPERRLYLDYKNVDLKQLASEVKTHAVERQIILATTNYKIIQEWKTLIPESETLLWMGGTEEALQKRIEDLRKAKFAGVTQLQLHVRQPKEPGSKDPFTPSNAFIIKLGKELRKHGILFQSLPWGMSDTESYRKLLDLGVASFATDHPEVTLKAVREYYQEKKSKTSTSAP